TLERVAGRSRSLALSSHAQGLGELLPECFPAPSLVVRKLRQRIGIANARELGILAPVLEELDASGTPHEVRIQNLPLSLEVRLEPACGFVSQAPPHTLFEVGVFRSADGTASGIVTVAAVQVFREPPVSIECLLEEMCRIEVASLIERHARECDVLPGI